MNYILMIARMQGRLAKLLIDDRVKELNNNLGLKQLDRELLRILSLSLDL